MIFIMHLINVRSNVLAAVGQHSVSVADLGVVSEVLIETPLSWILKFITYNNSQLAELIRNLNHQVLISQAQKATISTDPVLWRGAELAIRNASML